MHGTRNWGDVVSTFERPGYPPSPFSRLQLSTPHHPLGIQWLGFDSIKTVKSFVITLY
jgi:hypothetical protein